MRVQETEPGNVNLYENGAIGKPPVLTPELSALRSIETLRDRLADRLVPSTDPDLTAKLHALDLRIAAYVPKPAAPAGSAPAELATDATGADNNHNYYIDWSADALWFSKNFCASPGYCYTNRSGDGWVQRGSGVRNWSCTILNAGFNTSLYATFSSWNWDIFGNDYWAPYFASYLAPRTYQRYTNFSGDTVQRRCEANGSHWDLGAYWSDPSWSSSPAPTPSCNYIARAHTTACYNIDGSYSSIISQCGDGCGATPAEASANATTSLGTSVCLGAVAGCCSYVVDSNFNYCGSN